MVHVLVLVLESVCAEHLAAKSAGEALLIFCGMLVHEVFTKAVDPLEGLALGGTLVTQTEEPAIFFPHGHVHLGDLDISFVRVGMFKL